MDTTLFLLQFQDYLAPKFSTYEQAVYLYIIRHSRLIGLENVVIGFKSARTRMAFGIGKAGTSMSENQCYITVRSLEQLGAIKILGSERSGTRVHPLLPFEITGVVPSEETLRVVSIEEMDFFDDLANRPLILEREKHICFYCLRKINTDNYVIEHVISRPEGGNNYRNVVAACRSCNNRKGGNSAEEHLRVLYRESFLSEEDFADRLRQIELLQAGELKPECIPIPSNLKI